jgi:hypothetical protein
VTYNGYFERETSENHSYIILKPKKEFGEKKEITKNIPHLNLDKGVVILGLTEQNQGRRRDLGTTDPFSLSFFWPLISNNVHGQLASLEGRISISPERPGLSGGTTTGPLVDAFRVIHDQPMPFQRQFGTRGSSR